MGSLCYVAHGKQNKQLTENHVIKIEYSKASKIVCARMVSLGLQNLAHSSKVQAETIFQDPR